MARISDEELTRLKQDISLARLAETRGIHLKPHGNDLIGLCPFHDDNEPSLVISPQKNLWHCLGACQTGGSVIDWVMKAEGVSFRHAVELLREGYTPLATKHNKQVKDTTVRKLPNTLDLSAEDQTLLQQVMAYYHECLKQSPDALAYLESRGIKHAEAIDYFKLGFANRSLGYRLPEKNRKEGAAIRGRLQRLGLIRSSGHEHFNGSIVMPVMSRDGRYAGVPGGSTPANEQGVISEVYGRKINDNLRKGTPYHLFLPGPHRGVWNSEALQHSEEIILCESLIDALTFWVNGYRNVTASYGIEGFTKDHLQAFKQHNIQRVLIAYDRDDAGENAAQALAKKLIAEGIDCYRIHFPKNMDANEYAVKVQPAAKSLGLVIRKAHWLGKGEPPPRPMETSVKEIKQTAKDENVTKPDSYKKAFTPLVAPTPEDKEQQDTLPASVIPELPTIDVKAEVKDDEVIIALGDRRYRIRGLHKNLSHEQLKVNVLVSRLDLIHVDTFDLYAAKLRAQFIKQAGSELEINDEVIKKDVGKVLLKLEALQEQHINETLKPKAKEILLNDAEQSEALALLKDPDLLQRILFDFKRCGVVGEETNKLVGYLGAVSRKLDSPLAIIIQSSSAAGKSSLMDAVLALVPEEDKVQYSAMTGQSLFYMGETDLQHKILALAEEEGASQAAYALKLLQSEGELTIASTGKDPDSGRHVTHEYKVQGPVMLFSTTTAIDIDEELMNRCIVLSVDENREQTRAIHHIQRQRRTLNGLLAKKEKDRILTLHRNAQRLLKPLHVVNPFAEQLTFLDDRTRTRRDHDKYLTLIESIALLHQYQRAIKTMPHGDDVLQYVEVTLEDIETANQLAHEVLGRSLDELPPQTRKLLVHIETMVNEHCRQREMEKTDYHFSRKALRDCIGWGDTQLKIHLQRLVEMEYLLVHKAHGNRYEYELLYDGKGKAGEAFLSGLLDVEHLKHHYDDKRSGQTEDRSGSGRPPVGGQSGSGHDTENSDKAAKNKNLKSSDHEDDENAYIRGYNNVESYHSDTAAVMMAKGNTD
jgi:DNA primase